MSFDNTMPCISIFTSCILWMFFVDVQNNFKCFLRFSFWILEGWHSWQKCPDTSSESSPSPKIESIFSVPDILLKSLMHTYVDVLYSATLTPFMNYQGKAPGLDMRTKVSWQSIWYTSFQVSNSKNVGRSWKSRFQKSVTSLVMVLNLFYFP